MDHDPPEDRPRDRAGGMHLLLAERGSALLPEPVDADGRVTLTDAMLSVAALAPCFALARESIALGLAALAVALPALARTHVVMARSRALGAGPGPGGWLAAFLSSAFRLALILGLVAVIEAASLAIGLGLGSRLGSNWATAGAVSGFLALGMPLTLLALAYLIPRLLSVRDVR